MTLKQEIAEILEGIELTQPYEEAPNVIGIDIEKPLDQILKAVKQRLPEIVNTPKEVWELNKDLDSRIRQQVFDEASGYVDAIEQIEKELR